MQADGSLLRKKHKSNNKMNMTPPPTAPPLTKEIIIAVYSLLIIICFISDYVEKRQRIRKYRDAKRKWEEFQAQKRPRSILRKDYSRQPIDEEKKKDEELQKKSTVKFKWATITPIYISDEEKQMKRETLKQVCCTIKLNQCIQRKSNHGSTIQSR